MVKQKTRGQLFIIVSALCCLFFVVGGSRPQLPSDPGAPGFATPGSTNDPRVGQNDSSNNTSGYVIAKDEPAGNAPVRTENASLAKLPSIFNRYIPKRAGLAPKEFVTIGSSTYPLRTYQALALPNDPSANQPWVANVNLSAVWDLVPGTRQTTLAMIDTGFALNHEEFQNRWYQNTGETGVATSEASSKLNCTDRGLPLDYSCNLVDDNVDGIVDNETGAAPYENKSQLNCTGQGLPLDKSCNLIDDDGNGYIDDVRGWDMVNQDNSPQAGELVPSGTGTTHGTMTTGVAAASGNNGVGIAGVNWQTKILPIQALDDDSYGDTYTVGKAIYYAIDRKVDVINISLGSASDDPYVRQAVDAATAAGILVVASSGNDGCNCVAYPANYPEVLAVGATDQNNVVATFSSWGSSVDLAAPGTGYTVPTWSSTNQTSSYASGVAGTSFSSPLVAGMAAILKSQQPLATPLHLIAALRETANRVNMATGGAQDAHYGYGRIDATSVASRVVTDRHQPMSYLFSPVYAGGYFAGSPLETAGDYRVTECGNNPRNVKLYEAIKGAERFYTISESERAKAQSLGYSTPLFAEVCLRMPQDTQDVARFINIFRELRNLDVH